MELNLRPQPARQMANSNQLTIETDDPNEDAKVGTAAPDLRLDLNKLRTNAPGSNRYSQRNKIEIPNESEDDSSEILQEEK